MPIAKGFTQGLANTLANTLFGQYQQEDESAAVSAQRAWQEQQAQKDRDYKYADTNAEMAFRKAIENQRTQRNAKQFDFRTKESQKRFDTQLEKDKLYRNEVLTRMDYANKLALARLNKKDEKPDYFKNFVGKYGTNPEQYYKTRLAPIQTTYLKYLTGGKYEPDQATLKQLDSDWKLHSKPLRDMGIEIPESLMDMKMPEPVDYSWYDKILPPFMTGALDKNVQPQSTPAESTQRQGGQLMIDANGNKAMVYPDGTIEEVQ